MVTTVIVSRLVYDSFCHNIKEKILQFGNIHVHHLLLPPRNIHMLSSMLDAMSFFLFRICKVQFMLSNWLLMDR